MFSDYNTDGNKKKEDMEPKIKTKHIKGKNLVKIR